jgi:1-acyl-sn-glycerol-3-phosphate acyltransferase
MRFLSNIIGRIYLVYFLLLFIITMIPVYIVVLCLQLTPNPERTVYLHKIFKVWMGLFLPLVGCPVKTVGKQHFQKETNYVIVCNHNSFLDIPVSSPWIKGANKTLAKIEISRVPIFGLIYKTGSILVDRNNPNSKKESFSAMRKALQQGLHLCLYPEGTRNKTNQPLLPFQDGAFVVAIREQKAIMPSLIFNTKKILPNDKKFWAKPMPIQFHFLQPISTEGLTLKDIPELKEKIWNIMHSYYLNHDDK